MVGKGQALGSSASCLCEKHTRVTGFIIFDSTGEDIVRIGQVNQGTTYNQAELKSVLYAFTFIVNNGYWEDYVEVKGKNNLSMNFLTREWSPLDEVMTGLFQKSKGLEGKR